MCVREKVNKEIRKNGNFWEILKKYFGLFLKSVQENFEKISKKFMENSLITKYLKFNECVNKTFDTERKSEKRNFWELSVIIFWILAKQFLEYLFLEFVVCFLLHVSLSLSNHDYCKKNFFWGKFSEFKYFSLSQ